MSEKTAYSVQGSSSEPYIVAISLSPFMAECTCQAAEVGLPCRHRIKIISGEDPGIISGDKSKLPDIAEAAKKTPVFDLLKKYEGLKADKKAVETAADKAFKKYRDSRIDLLQGKVKTDRAVVKAQAAMESSIEAIIPVHGAIDEVLAALRDIFIRPSVVVGDLAAAALNDSD
jgi:hypothetical protein